MVIEKIIKEELSDKEKMKKLRLKSSGIAFVIVCFSFFTNLYLCGAGLCTETSKASLSILYILLIASLMVYAFFFLINKFTKFINGFKIYILVGLLIVLSLILMLPVIIR